MDASSRFHPDHRIGNFWSVSGAYRISSEPWFKEYVRMEIITNMRIRASYGENGALPRQYYRWRDGYEPITFMGASGVMQNYHPMKNLTWEKNRVWNVGLDMRLFPGDRIRLSAEYFNRKSRDLLRSVRVSGTTGNQSILMNTPAGILNTGLEFEVLANVLRKRKHSLDFKFNIAAVKSVYYGLEVQEFFDNRQLMANGHQVRTWFMYESVGVNPETGSVLYVKFDEDGNRFVGQGNADAEYQFLGQGRPKASGGFSLNYSYGRWSLSTLCSYGVGHHIYDNVGRRGMAYWSNDFAITVDQFDRWNPDNPNATTPLRIRNTAAPGISSLLLYKGDYLKIRNIKLQYTMPREMANKMKLTGASIFGQVDTPFIFTHIPGGHDPEQSPDGYRRTDAYPTVTTFTIGLTMNF